jgi:hypothetical protein
MYMPWYIFILAVFLGHISMVAYSISISVHDYCNNKESGTHSKKKPQMLYDVEEKKQMIISLFAMLCYALLFPLTHGILSASVAEPEPGPEPYYFAGTGTVILLLVPVLASGIKRSKIWVWYISFKTNQSRRTK